MRKSLLLILIQAGLLLSNSGGTAGLPQTPNPSSDDEPIRNLAIKITTDGARGAGTNNTIYFDIGPLAWKLNKPSHNDFESGATDTYDLIHDGKIVNMKNAPDVTITRGDILWLRLHKKGIFGVTGFGDGIGGAWHPSTIILIVNGRESQPVSVNSALNSRCWYWRSDATKDPAELITFAHSLRMVRNTPLNLLAKVTGILTTPIFKKKGISGWLASPRQKECPAPHIESARETESLMCATGDVTEKATSTDGLQTIDLKVWLIERMSQPAQAVVLDEANGFTQPRFLRVESLYGHNILSVGMRAKICGRLRWDTDLEGWWEIHPRSAADVALSSR